MLRVDVRVAEEERVGHHGDERGGGQGGVVEGIDAGVVDLEGRKGEMGFLPFFGLVDGRRRGREGKWWGEVDVGGVRGRGGGGTVSVGARMPRRRSQSLSS